MTSFLGREHDLANVTAALAAHRVVTLVGGPGVGKTRLAVEAVGATALAVVDLTGASDGTAVPRTVAAAFGLRDTPVAQHLAREQGVLLLDNCEHVVDAVADLVEELRTAPGVTVLATSREPIGVTDECTLPLDPLSDEAAVRLFRERAALVRADALAETDDVADVCRRLDGYPLAIELAAATLRTLTLGDLAARLDARLDLLVSAPRTAPPRHRSLRAAIDASYATLDSDERRLLGLLSAFRGWFPLDAVDDVPTLSRLVAKSLVTAAPPRYRLAESIGLYARERIEDPAEAHAALVRWARRAASRPAWPDEADWVDRVAADAPSLDAALAAADVADHAALTLDLAPAWLALGRLEQAERHLARALDAGAGETERLAALAAQVALAAGRPQDARAHLDRAGQQPRARVARAQLANGEGDYAAVTRALDGVDTAALAEDDVDTAVSALVARATSARAQADYPAALRDAEAALEIAQRYGHTRGVTVALLSVGSIHRVRGEVAAARAVYHRALVMARAPGALAVAYGSLGSLAVDDGDLPEALTLLERALDAGRAAGDQRTTLVTLHNLAETYRLAGEFDAARTRFGEALAIARSMDERRSASWILGSLGDIAQATGDLDAAASLYRESLAIRAAVLDRRGLALGFDAVAAYALARRQPYAAARLLAAATALREAVGSPREPTVQRSYDDLLAQVMSALDPSEAADALGAGALLDLPEAVAEARRVLDVAATDAPEPRPADAPSRPLHVRTLGGFAVLRDGVPVDARAWQSKKARDLLKILVAHRGRPVHREALMDALWPDGDPAVLPNRLSVALSTLRGVLDPGRTAPAPVVVADRTAVALNLDVVDVDVERFLDDVAAGRLAAAERAYTGDFLPEDAYDEWAVPLREQARVAYVGAARSLARAAERDADPDTAARLALRILELDPYDEDAHRTLVRSLSAAARHGEARAAQLNYTRRMAEIGLKAT